MTHISPWSMVHPSCDSPELRGATALIWAAREGREALVQRLIKAGADIQKAEKLRKLGDFWETVGKNVGNTWETHGKHIGKHKGTPLKR